MQYAIFIVKALFACTEKACIYDVEFRVPIYLLLLLFFLLDGSSIVHNMAFNHINVCVCTNISMRAMKFRVACTYNICIYIYNIYKYSLHNVRFTIVTSCSCRVKYTMFDGRVRYNDVCFSVYSSYWYSLLPRTTEIR